MATLTKAMLADLHKGNATIKMVACPASGEVAFTGSSALTFSGADELYTLKGTLNIAPSDATLNDIQIDQMDEIIDTDVNMEDYTITGNVPSNSTALYDYFFDVGKTVSQMVSGDTGITYDGKSYFNASKEVYVSVLVQSESKKTAVAFARVRAIALPPTQDDSDNPAYMKFTGRILHNLKAGEGDFAVLTQHTT